MEPFGKTATSLSRNPLGIIALFIVLVYGIAALVLGLGGDDLAVAQKWPLIWFFVLFPVVVLAVFTWLVSRHHVKLYAPGDFRDDQSFFGRTPPPDIRAGAVRGATAEGREGIPAPDEVERIVAEGVLPPGISEDYYLVHESAVVRPETGQENGLYRVRVSLEASTPDLLDTVTRVTYRLHSTFRNRIIATAARDKNFELWLNVWGEFLVIAYVELATGESLWTSRYLDLPGRPDA